MKRILLNAFTILVILYGIFWVLDEIFTSTFQAGNYTKTQWLYKMQDQEFDYAIHGSSRAYTTINIEEIENETNLRGINISVDGSNITDQYLMLKLFLEHNNKIDHLYLQVDPWSANDEYVQRFSIPKFFPYIKEKAVFDHFKTFGADWYAYRYIPFYRYARYNTIWGVHQFFNDAFNLVPQDFDKHGGYFYNSVAYTGDSLKLRKLAFKLDGEYKYLNQIIALCHENNIRLTLFTSPVSDILIDEDYKHNVAAFTSMMREQGVEYVNYGDIYGNEIKMFTDAIHLNKYGVKDFTQRIKADLLGGATENAKLTLNKIPAGASTDKPSAL
ncbi:hypothetical protein [Pontibacter beigongshangensis]|uniref:hypothetical protein n=1 Tax=Pontibacter beigongshangensis TaxID=2574733 RepID=UPI0016504271|nr:hypothetical protein [Pontibacter beigongshangensis]